jgi:hypothetical protein
MIEALHVMANSKNTTIKTFEFKLRLNKSFVGACERELEHPRQIYNAALAERISCYQITGKTLDLGEQSLYLTDARQLPEVKTHLRTIQQDALERVTATFAQTEGIEAARQAENQSRQGAFESIALSQRFPS